MKNKATYTSQTGWLYNNQLFQGVFQHTTVGAVTELNENEYRVALTPAIARELVQNGHKVYFQSGFGNRAGFPCELYKQAGAQICNSADEVYKQCNIILKVNPPQEQEYGKIQSQQVIFCFTSAACCPKQQQQFVQVMTERRATVVSYNTLINTTTFSNLTPVCYPVHHALTEVAGYLAVQQAMQLMEVGGNKTLFGQVAGIPGVNVLILGANPCGIRAAALAAGTGAMVTVMDTNTDALRYLNEMVQSVNTMQYTQENLEKMLPTVNTLIGCVVPTYTKAPVLVTQAQLKLLQQGSIVIDLASCKGGNFENTTPRNFKEAATNWNGITMFAAADITCMAPKTASCALAQSALPYILQVANKGWKKAVIEFRGLQEGVCIAEGCVTNNMLACHTQSKYTPVEQVLEGEIQKIANNQQETNIANLKQQLSTFRIQEGSSFTIEA